MASKQTSPTLDDAEFNRKLDEFMAEIARMAGDIRAASKSRSERKTGTLRLTKHDDPGWDETDE
jgi:hypothetical protein